MVRFIKAIAAVMAATAAATGAAAVGVNWMPVPLDRFGGKDPDLLYLLLSPPVALVVALTAAAIVCIAAGCLTAVGERLARAFGRSSPDGSDDR